MNTKQKILALIKNPHSAKQGIELNSTLKVLSDQELDKLLRSQFRTSEWQSQYRTLFDMNRINKIHEGWKRLKNSWKALNKYEDWLPFEIESEDSREHLRLDVPIARLFRSSAVTFEDLKKSFVVSMSKLEGDINQFVSQQKGISMSYIDIHNQLGAQPMSDEGFFSIIVILDIDLRYFMGIQA